MGELTALQALQLDLWCGRAQGTGGVIGRYGKRGGKGIEEEGRERGMTVWSNPKQKCGCAARL